MFTLKVDRELELQLFQFHHSNELFQLVSHNRKFLQEWLPWINNYHSPQQFQQIISYWLKQFSDSRSLHTGIRYHNILVGAISLNHIDWENLQTSIGYFIREDFQGRGIMTRSARALINYAFYDLKLHRIEISCGELNKKSQAIPTKLGFKIDGIIRDGEKINNHFHNLVIYSMLSNEWRYY